MKKNINSKGKNKTMKVTAGGGVERKIVLTSLLNVVTHYFVAEIAHTDRSDFTPPPPVPSLVKVACCRKA